MRSKRFIHEAIAVLIQLDPSCVWEESTWWVVSGRGVYIGHATDYAVNRAPVLSIYGAPYVVENEGAHESEEGLIKYLIRKL